jgi:hypothetical protein
MQIVIDIDEEDYKIMQHNVAVDNPLCPLGQKEIVTRIANGIPLPKGHGRLGDLDRAIDIAKETKTDNDKRIIINFLNTLQPIIKADKTESEDKE